MFKNKKIFFLGITLGIFLFFIFSNFVFGQEFYGATESAKKIGLKTDTDLVNLTGNLLGVIFSFISVVFFILIIYSGILWMTARGNDQQTEKAKEIIIGAVAGVILIVGAFAITNFVFDNTDFNTPSENKFYCDSSLGWQCVDIAYADVRCRGEKIAGTDFYELLLNTEGAETKDRCNNSEYCKTTTENCLGNQVCCQPYKTGCEEVYGSSYSCIDSVENCSDLNTVKYESGLCENEGTNNICCQYTQVWCLLADFTCISQTGSCGNDTSGNRANIYKSKTECEATPDFINNKQVFCFYEDETEPVSAYRWKCDPMNQGLCLGTTKKGFPFDSAGECARALDSKFGIEN